MLNASAPAVSHTEHHHAGKVGGAPSGSDELVFGKMGGSESGGGGIAFKELAPAWSAFVVDCGSGKLAVYEYGTDAMGRPAEMGKVSFKMQVADLLVRQTSEGAGTGLACQRRTAATLPPPINSPQPSRYPHQTL